MLNGGKRKMVVPIGATGWKSKNGGVCWSKRWCILMLKGGKVKWRCKLVLKGWISEIGGAYWYKGGRKRQNCGAYWC